MRVWAFVIGVIMKVLKTFVRNGKKYRRGDALPEDLDKPTFDKYERHGMVGELVVDDAAPQDGEGATTTVAVRNGSAGRRTRVARVVELTGSVGQVAPTNAQAPSPSNAATPNTPHGEGAGPDETKRLGAAGEDADATGDTGSSDTGSGEQGSGNDAAAGGSSSDAPTGDAPTSESTQP